jgi:hypothetical protein
MEPLKPEAKQKLLNRPQASPQDVEEYERPLSERYTRDPNPDPRTRPAAAPIAAPSSSEARLKDLYQKLYGKTP